MKILFLMPVLLLTLVIPAGGQPPQANGRRSDRNETELRGLTDELAGSISTNQQEGIERFIADEFVFIDSSGRGVRKRTFLGELRSGRWRLEKGQDVNLFLSGRRASMSGLRVIIERRGCESPGSSGISPSSSAEQEKWAVIERQLLRRVDLMPVLFEVLKAIGIQEIEMFGQLAEARSKLLNALQGRDGGRQSPTRAEVILRANDDLSAAIDRILRVSLNYLQLRSSEPYLNVTDELYWTERRITDAFCDYGALTGRNTNVRTHSEERVTLGWVRASARSARQTKNGSRWRLVHIASEAADTETVPGRKGAVSDHNMKLPRETQSFEWGAKPARHSQPHSI